MNLWLIGELTPEQIRIGADLGFNGYVNTLFTPETQERAEAAHDTGLTLLYLVPVWSHFWDTYDVKALTANDWAFRNADGHSSFRGLDGAKSGNAWPSYWNPDPEILELARRHFEEAYNQGAEGFLVTTSQGECKFPCHWGDEQKQGGPEDYLRYSYWCHDEHAKHQWDLLRQQEEKQDIAAYNRASPKWNEAEVSRWTEQSIAKQQPAANPLQDDDLTTRDFCQAGMIHRLNQLCEIALDFRPLVIPIIGPWVPEGSTLYRAVGYSGLHEKLNEWQIDFRSVTGVQPQFWIPALYNGPQEKINHGHNLVQEWNWKLWAGGQCDGIYGPWPKMLTCAIIEALNHDLQGLICNGREMLSSPENIVEAKRCLAIRR